MPASSTLRITRRAADRLRAGHLWVYRTDLEPNQPLPDPGALTTVADSRNLPLGTALYSSASQIAARLVSRIPGLTRDQYLAEVKARVSKAIQRRRLVPDPRREFAAMLQQTDLGKRESFGFISLLDSAGRLVFSEADDLPGIIIDRYNDLVIVQLLTQGTARDDVRAVLVDTLSLELSPETAPLMMAPGQHVCRYGVTIWERPDPRIRELEQLAAPLPGPLFSSLPKDLSSRPEAHSAAVERPAFETGDDAAAPTTTTFTLNNLHFHYDAAAGQKTGAFLDQRLNYASAARVVRASGRTGNALDVCTYHGGFALHLAQVCQSVTGIDASRSALQAADHNLTLNPSLSSCNVEWIEADAFDYLRHLDDQARTIKGFSSRPERSGVERPASGTTTNPKLFDAIVLDPPAFAKSKRAAEGAARGYKELNLRAIRLLAPGGTLITNSCSHHVSLGDFTAIVASAAADAGRRVQLLETHAAAPDHPEVLTLPETRYLKCLICRID